MDASFNSEKADSTEHYGLMQRNVSCILVSHDDMKVSPSAPRVRGPVPARIRWAPPRTALTKKAEINFAFTKITLSTFGLPGRVPFHLMKSFFRTRYTFFADSSLYCAARCPPPFHPGGEGGGARGSRRTEIYAPVNSRPALPTAEYETRLKNKK